MKCFEQKKRKTMTEVWANCPNPLGKIKSSDRVRMRRVRKKPMIIIPSELYEMICIIDFQKGQD